MRTGTALPGTPTAIRINTDELLNSMCPEYAYTQDEVFALLYDMPKCAVKEALYTLVEDGKVWRDRSGSKIKYTCMSDTQLTAIQERKADVCDTPAWMGSKLTGYEAWIAKHRDLAMMTRRA
jgi:hypothetical protein